MMSKHGLLMTKTWLVPDDDQMMSKHGLMMTKTWSDDVKVWSDDDQNLV